jgi:putative hydrolase of the HAD superfamily
MIKKAVLLDAGGVLLDETEMEELICVEFLKLISKVKPDYTVSQFWIDTEEAVQRFAPRTRPFIIWKYSDNDPNIYTNLNNQFQLKLKEINTKLCLMDGINEELIDLNKKYNLILAGQYGSKIYDLFEMNHLDHLFIYKISQDDYSITKPDPRYLEKIAIDSGFKPDECIMVGDRIDNDIIPAKQNGMGTVFLKTGIYKNQKPRDMLEIPDVILPSVYGLASAINEKWNTSNN